jgi:hypothetical protein
MKQLICERCGGNEFSEKDGFRICKYCSTKFTITFEEVKPRSSNIALNEDIELLLKKCIEDPANSRRYTSLILDIDPSNAEAIRINKLSGKY